MNELQLYDKSYFEKISLLEDEFISPVLGGSEERLLGLVGYLAKKDILDYSDVDLEVYAHNMSICVQIAEIHYNHYDNDGNTEMNKDDFDEYMEEEARGIYESYEYDLFQGLFNFIVETLFKNKLSFRIDWYECESYGGFNLTNGKDAVLVYDSQVPVFPEMFDEFTRPEDFKFLSKIMFRDNGSYKLLQRLGGQ